MKILVLSAEVWRDDKNGGNVLSNIFSDFDAEFAQIYCNPGEPSNKICKYYYQMTDRMIIKNLFTGKKVGKKFFYDNCLAEEKEQVVVAEQENKKIYNFFRRFSWSIFHIAREVAWSLSRWKNEELEKFIVDFSPDIIFAPCYASHFMLHLTRYVATLTKKPIISYVSDDNYTLNQFRFSPFYWINRFVLRRNMRRTYPYYSLVYTMTEEQKKIYEKALHCKMSVLKKSGDFQVENIKKNIEFPIRIIYAGGLYCGRDATLIKLVRAIKNINQNSQKFMLDIYTGSVLSNKKERILNDGKNSVLHGIISKEQLTEQYKKSDLALHVESFRLKYKKLTRLSFSTKIMDCLESGAAVLAIADEGQAGLAYLKRNNIGLTITDLKKIEPFLKRVADDPNQIIEYSQRAYNFCVKEHEKEKISKKIKEDFEYYCIIEQKN